MTSGEHLAGVGVVEPGIRVLEQVTDPLPLGILRFDLTPLALWIAPAAPPCHTLSQPLELALTEFKRPGSPSELVILPASAISIVRSLRTSFIVNVIVSPIHGVTFLFTYHTRNFLD